MQIIAAPEMLLGNMPEGWTLALLRNTILIVKSWWSWSFERRSQQNMEGTFFVMGCYLLKPLALVIS
jgi:hypothetical protein